MRYSPAIFSESSIGSCTELSASVKGRSFEQVRDGLVIPSGGEVIETELPKK
jgi:hypothetical protein